MVGITSVMKRIGKEKGGCSGTIVLIPASLFAPLPLASLLLPLLLLGPDAAHVEPCVGIHDIDASDLAYS